MATSKPQASICYNTDRFLKKTLQQLTDNGILEWWFYIEHEPDTDDRVRHKHIWIKPRKPIDTVELEKEFIQYQKGNKKPLRCIGFSFSEINNALLYFLHDKDYLRCKHKSRNIHYKYSDLKTSDKLKLEYNYRAAMEYLHSELMQDLYIEDQLKEGAQLCKLADDGLITSRNAWKMKNFKDVLSDRKMENIYKEYQAQIDNLQSEFEEVRSLRKELERKTKTVDSKLKLIQVQQERNKELNKQLRFNLDNPFIGGVENVQN